MNKNLKELTDSNYNDLVKAEQLTIIDFWAEWCGPCKMMLPIFTNIAENNNDENLSFLKMNVDENSKIPYKFNIRSIPTILFLKDDKEIFRFTGPVSRQVLENKINELK